MSEFHKLFSRVTQVSALSLAWFLAARTTATVLSDNLSSITAGTEIADVTHRITGSFTTDASPHTLNSITLLLANTSAGTTALDLNANGGLEPGALVATLTSPAGYSATPAATIFTASGVTLAANTTYWIVLRPISGQFEWAWTASDSGSGVGFVHTWGITDDAGQSWWTYDTYQTQFSVTVDVLCNLPGDLNGDHQIDLSDLAALLAHFGASSGATLADGDIDADGDVDLSDLAVLLAHFGASC